MVKELECTFAHAGVCKLNLSLPLYIGTSNMACVSICEHSKLIKFFQILPYIIFKWSKGVTKVSIGTGQSVQPNKLCAHEPEKNS